MSDREALARAAQHAKAAPSPVPSPCVSVCRMNDATGLCEGCLRTIDEIAAWGALPEPARRAVWALIGERAAAAAAAQQPTGNEYSGPA